MTIVAALTPIASAQLSPLSIDIHENAPEFGADFGWSAAAGDINGDGYDDAVIGAPHADVAALTDAGRVVIKYGPSFSTEQTISAPKPGAGFGFAVACGDLNGDSFDDVAVGAPTEDGAILDIGRVYVFFGPGLTTTTTISAPSPTQGADFGQALAIGDVVGNGLNDLIVGSPEARVGGISVGQVFVFTGGALTLSSTLTSPAAGVGRHYGWSVAIANIDGAGKNELIVGEPNAPVGALVEAGKVYVYSGSTLALQKTLQEPTPVQSAEFGTTVAVGDINGDGFGDLAANVGDGNPLGVIDAGEVFVFFGPALGAPTQVREPVVEQGADFGWSLAIGDVNGDGNDDLVVGAQDSVGDDGTQNHDDAGEGFLFFGPSLATSTQLKPVVIHTDDDFGYSATIGDFNGDGLMDPLIGSKDGEVTGIADQGRANAFIWQANFGVTSIGLSASTGGAIGLTLNGGAAKAGRPYAMLSSSLGSSPGFQNGQVHVPLNVDPLLTPILLSLPGAIGVLNGAGVANIAIGAPPGVIPPAAAGLKLTFAWITTDFFNFASYPVVIEVIP